jgi:hypothetical protein
LAEARRMTLPEARLALDLSPLWSRVFLLREALRTLVDAGGVTPAEARAYFWGELRGPVPTVRSPWEAK